MRRCLYRFLNYRLIAVLLIESYRLLYGFFFFSSRRRHTRSEEHTSELQSRSDIVCRLLLEKKKTQLQSQSELVCHRLLEKKNIRDEYDRHTGCESVCIMRARSSEGRLLSRHSG